MIAEELGLIPSAIEENRDSQDFEYPTDEDYIPEEMSIKTKIGEKPGEVKYKVVGIPDDEGVNPKGFIDIEVEANGNVALTQRNAKFGGSATMIFKTKENGGNNPIAAAVFVRIAKRICDAFERNTGWELLPEETR